MITDIYTNATVLTDRNGTGAQTGLTTGNWYLKNITTVQDDPAGIITSLTSSQITLQAGTYLVQGVFGAYQCNQSRIRLYDVTAGAAVAYSSCGFGQYIPVTPCPDLHNTHITEVFTLTEESVLEVQYRVGNATNANLGVGGSPLGGDTTNSILRIAKLEDQRRIAIFRDEKANGTGGGHATTGAWRTRTLNTEAYNSISGASLSSNQITLPTGLYYIFAQAPTRYTGTSKCALYNVTDNTYIVGGGAYSNSTGPSGKPDDANVTISIVLEVTGGPKVYEFVHYFGASSYTGFGSVGLGSQTSFGVNEIYASVLIIGAQ